MACAHCYVAAGDTAGDHADAEMETGSVIALLDEIADAGCLFLLFTGGEPLIRRDFPAIYRHARGLGLLVSVFTNGTLVTEEIADLFAGMPPRRVEVSIYGATARTHDAVTGVAGSYDQCLSGIRRLLDRGVKLTLKTVLMTLNRHEFRDMERLAEEFGVGFRFDPALFPRLDGDTLPLSLRVPAGEAVAREMENDRRRERWRRIFERGRDLPVSDRLYTCGAGLTHFHVTPSGVLQPCSMTSNFGRRLAGGDFAAIWREFMPRIREKRAGAGFPCPGCEKRTLCGLCPAFFRMETGSEEKPSEYLCALGEHRLLALREDAVGKRRPTFSLRR